MTEDIKILAFNIYEHHKIQTTFCFFGPFAVESHACIHSPAYISQPYRKSEIRFFPGSDIHLHMRIHTLFQCPFPFWTFRKDWVMQGVGAHRHERESLSLLLTWYFRKSNAALKDRVVLVNPRWSVRTKGKTWRLPCSKCPGPLQWWRTNHAPILPLTSLWEAKGPRKNKLPATTDECRPLESERRP